jgi:hypothetical protein
MVADYRHRTSVAFGAIEAHAKRHLRVAQVIGTSMLFSLQDARPGRLGSSPLVAFRDGEPLDPAALRLLVPSIGTVTWDFSRAGPEHGCQLTAITDNIQVTLSMNDAADLDEDAAEAKLRGTAARLVVAVSYRG